MLEFGLSAEARKSSRALGGPQRPWRLSEPKRKVGWMSATAGGGKNKPTHQVLVDLGTRGAPLQEMPPSTISMLPPAAVQQDAPNSKP